MVKPLFEWQQEWDGTQPAICEKEKEDVGKDFGDFVRIVLTMQRAKTPPNRPGTRMMHLAGNDPRGPIDVTVSRNVEPDDQFSSYILLRHTVDLAKLGLATTLRDRANIASYYLFNHVGDVVRDDFDTQPKLDPFSDHGPGIYIEDAETALATEIKRQTAVLEFERESGFAKQPIDYKEVTRLIQFVGSAR